MKRKNAFWLSLICGTAFAFTPMLAQAAQQNGAAAPPPPQNSKSASTYVGPDQLDAQRAVLGPYRLTYTVTELDGNKRVGSQRCSIVLDAGSEIPSTALRLGSKIPIVTGELQGGSASQTISYIDVGFAIDASLRSYKNGLELRSHIVQSAIDTQQSPTKQPVIRQSDLKSTVLLNENKPVTIGNVDMPGSTHILQIQVEISKLP
ncbi:MAG TPA: hypothetical protein VN670_10140 [Acidobacteriaceae bacterium]|nr:hypothetical protein [Acidobacteriaceae bacterium]